jgi:hypothetical protein
LALKLNIRNKEVRTREREWMTPAPADSAVEELPDGLLRAGYRHRAAPDLSQPSPMDYSVGGWLLLPLPRLSPPRRKISEFSTKRSAMAVAMVVL